MSDLKYQDIVEAISQIKRNQLDEAKEHSGGVGGGFRHGGFVSSRKTIPRRNLNPENINPLRTRAGAGKGATAAVAGGALAGGLGAAASQELDKRARAERQAMAGKGIKEEAPLINPEIARQAKTPGYVKVPGGFDAPVGPSAEGIFKQGKPLSIDPRYVEAVNSSNSIRNVELGLDGRPNISTRVRNFFKPGGPLAPNGYSGIPARMAAEKKAREGM